MEQSAWTKCSCGHIAQDHNQLSSVERLVEPEPHEYGCDRCECTNYDGKKVDDSARATFVIKKHKLMAAASRCAVLQSHCEDLVSEGYPELQEAADLLEKTGEKIMASYEEHLASDPRRVQLVKEEET